MRIALTLMAFIFLVMPRVQAAPLNNQVTKEVKPSVKTEVVQPTITSEAPTPASQEVVPVQEQPQEIVEPPVTDESEAKAFIYFKESGNNPLAKNSIGCFGLGQDCNGIVEQQCGGNYDCQDRFFTEYMLRRYGTWQAAKSFWLSRVPINGSDVGHWW